MYALALHPTLDVLMTGGRDSVCRVWDMRTKVGPPCFDHALSLPALDHPVQPGS